MTSPVIITSSSVISAIQRVCTALLSQADYLTSLDQAVGDGGLDVGDRRQVGPGGQSAERRKTR